MQTQLNSEIVYIPYIEKKKTPSPPSLYAFLNDMFASVIRSTYLVIKQFETLAIGVFLKKKKKAFKNSKKKNRRSFA